MLLHWKKNILIAPYSFCLCPVLPFIFRNKTKTFIYFFVFKVEVEFQQTLYTLAGFAFSSLLIYCVQLVPKGFLIFNIAYLLPSFNIFISINFI